jgi:hypothetical protein
VYDRGTDYRKPEEKQPMMLREAAWAAWAACIKIHILLTEKKGEFQFALFYFPDKADMRYF